MADLDAKLARRIREVREGIGLSQGDLARRMNERGHQGFQQQTIARIESGNRKVTYGEAVDLATAMNHTAEGLVGVPGEDALVAKGARVGETSEVLADAAIAYTHALFDFVVTADQIESPIRDNQQQYLKTVFARQTPAMLTLDSGTALSAAMSRARISEPGVYLKQLVEAIERDEDALSGNRPTLDELHKRDG
ncbi:MULTISPECIES: helix-turn-helix domain-containing protein [unclassified Leucobacter]|uniref:helix-turn-helix domain-containing protein n=1 Tax=unclassified Leucobacter TaxID=2621730 RepID=UPI00301A0984